MLCSNNWIAVLNEIDIELHLKALGHHKQWNLWFILQYCWQIGFNLGSTNMCWKTSVARLHQQPDNLLVCFFMLFDLLLSSGKSRSGKSQKAHIYYLFYY